MTVEIWLLHDADPQNKTCLRLDLQEEDVGQVIDFIRAVRRDTVRGAWYQVEINGFVFKLDRVGMYK